MPLLHSLLLIKIVKVESMSEPRRLKILHITAWYPRPEQPLEGIFIREHVHASALHHDPLVWAFYDQTDTGSPAIKVADTVEEGIRTIRTWLPVGRMPKLRYLFRLRRLVKFGGELASSTGCPDVIHAHTYQAGVPTVILGRKLGVPVVISEHWSGFALKTLNAAERMKARYALRRARYVLPVSRFLSEQIASYGIRSQFRIVPNVVDTALFHYSERPPRDANDPIRLLAVASMTPIKGIPVLLGAVRQSRSAGILIQLDLVGGGPQRSEYERLSQTLGLADIVRFHGPLIKAQVARLMQAADIFVHPSLMETFSVVIAEALCCGLPVVASDLPAIRDLVDESNGILTSVGDIAMLAQSLERTIADHHRYDRFAISENARVKYNLPAVAAQLDGIYRGVAVNA